MKKALSVFLMAAMAFGAFADEPVADVNVAEFSGNAAVTWGVDLDSGTTGFKNSTEVNLKLNLLKGGSKSTTGDGVWGELVLKADGDPLQWQQKDFSDDAFAANEGMTSSLNYKVYVDTAKIHLGPAYIGLKTGDTQTGKLKMDGAIRSADSNNATTLADVGPKDYSQGIVAGYDSDMFKLDLDLRSKPTTKAAAKRIVAYILDKDGGKATGAPLVEGDVIHYYDGSTYTVTAKDVEDGKRATVGELSDLGGATPNNYYYTDNYAFAFEGEFKGVENLSVKAGVSYNFAKNYQPNKTTTAKTSNGDVKHTLGYSASVGYKLALNDTFFVRPQVGFAGQTGFGTYTRSGYSADNFTAMNMAAGVLFGWGEIGQDKNAGVYFLNKDDAKKVTPGIALVAEIPLPSIYSGEENGKKGKEVITGTTLAWLQPSLYTGELIPGLTAAAYADIQITQKGKTKTTYDGKTLPETETAKPDAAMAFAFGVKYALNVEELTITPQFGLRFVNEEYKAANANRKKTVFDSTNNYALGESKGNDDYMNVKLGVDVAGLVDNTTFSVVWTSENLNNTTDLADTNDPKLGTLDFTAKIAL